MGCKGGQGGNEHHCLLAAIFARKTEDMQHKFCQSKQINLQTSLVIVTERCAVHNGVQGQERFSRPSQGRPVHSVENQV